MGQINKSTHKTAILQLIHRGGGRLGEKELNNPLQNMRQKNRMHAYKNNRKQHNSNIPVQVRTHNNPDNKRDRIKTSLQNEELK